MTATIARRAGTRPSGPRDELALFLELFALTGVAVAVNGRVGGVMTTLVRSIESDRPRFWTMIPPSLLVPGRNEIELFLVEGDPGSVRLAPMALDGGDE